MGEVAGTWTYSGDPNASPLDAVRWLAGDTEEGDQLVSDEEIAFALAENSDNARGAAALVLQALAVRFAREADKTVGDLSVDLSQKSTAFAERAEMVAAGGTFGSRVSAGPLLTGSTYSDKSASRSDSDRLKPSFEKGMHDRNESSEEWVVPVWGP